MLTPWAATRRKALQQTDAINPYTPGSEAEPSFSALLPIRIYQVNWRFTCDTSLPFFHQAVVTSFIRTMLKSSHQAFFSLAIHTPESGRQHYQTGDAYSFYLCQFGEDLNLIEQLFERLDNLPYSAQQAGCSGHIGTNVELRSIKDGLSGGLLAEPSAAAVIDQDSIDQQIGLWQEYAPSQLSLQFVSPLRLKPRNSQPQLKKKNRGAPLCQCEADLSAELVFERIFDALASLQQQLKPQLERARRPAPPAAEWLDSDLFWVDAYYGRVEGSSQDKPARLKPINGLLGSIDLNLPALTQAQWQWLVMGQYIGIGENRRFGCGRYRLLTQDGQSIGPQLERATSLLNEALNIQDIESAFHYELEKLSGQPKAYAARADIHLLYQQLQQGHYWPEPLYPSLLQEPGKKERLLLIPDFTDKVVLKTLSRWFSQSLDCLYSERSYGYRRGFSRLAAKDKILALVRQGYAYALDADIRSFFPSVDVERVLNRLACLYGNDPLWPLIDRYLHANIQREALPEHYQDHQSSGLHLGSSLSPVLANLMLDHLDSVLIKLDYQLVRYADDFIILCKKKNQAEQAKELVQSLLAEHDLELNEQKTRVRRFASGVHFLGYLFINDMVIESKQNTYSDALPNKPILAPENSNKSQLFFSATAKQTLCISGDPCLLNLQHSRIRVEREGEAIAELPLHHLECIVLLGHHQITTQALTKAMQLQVPVHFASHFGKYQGCAALLSHNPALHLKQAAHFSEEKNQMAFSQSLVEAKIRSLKELLRQRKTQCESLNSGLKMLPKIHSLEQCLGVEGQAAKGYWHSFSSLIDKQWQFTHRQKRYPKDPINSLLSFGYSLLYSHTDSLLRSAGLCPTIGGYHHSRGTHSALASDLMEPFRYLVDRSVLSVINRGQIKLEHFTDYQGQSWLNKETKQFWCKYLIEQLQTPQFANDKGDQVSALDLLAQQNYNLIAWINQEQSHFSPWLAR